MFQQISRSEILIFALIAFLFTASLAFAQRQTGAIEGVVQDAAGQAIPGVTIMASSPSLIGGSSITMTNQNGFYRFPALASGIYEVKAELAGYQALVRRDIGLSVGFTQTVHFSLSIAGAHEIVEVVGTPPLIDMTSTAVAFTIPQKLIENLPKSKNIEDLMALTPGVSDNLGFDRGDIVNLMAYGAQGEIANSVWIDGVNVSNPRSGDLTMGYSQDWIQEVHVTGIGAPAEYGGFTGVVANYTTRAGGNQFHGLFDTFFQNDNLTWSNVPESDPDRKFTSYDFSAQLGGPVLRNKLWFFAGLQFPHTETPSPGFDEINTETFRKVITKGTYQWNESNTLQAFGTWNEQVLEREGATLNRTAEANHLKSENPQWSWNATWISLVSDKTNFEGRFGGTNDHFKHSEERPDAAQHIDRGTGLYSVNNAELWDMKNSRLQMNAALSHHADDFIQGNHDFRFGVQFQQTNIQHTYHYNGNFLAYYDYFGAPAYRGYISDYGLEGATHQVGTFLQDDWQISDSLILNLGVRWDHNRGSGDTAVFYETDPVAPRVGFVWILNQENQTAIKAHYGDYYDSLVTRLSGETVTFPAGAWQKFENGEWVDVHRNEGNSSEFGTGSGLKHSYVRQFTAGIDRVLPGNIPFGAHYIYRRWENLRLAVNPDVWEPVPFENPLTGEIMTVYRFVSEGGPSIFTNPPGLYRRYDGLELFGNKQFADKLYLSGSLIYSKLTGNLYSNISGGSFQGDSPNASVNRDGKLENDRSFNWKITGTYALPWGFNTGFYFRHESGGAWTPVGFIPPEVTNTCCGDSVLLEPLGSRRIPSRNVLDLRVEKQFPVYVGQLRFTVDIFNVFNIDSPTGVSTFFGSPTFGEPGGFIQPRQMRLGIRYTF